MWNSWGGNSCLWIILILIVIFCCGSNGCGIGTCGGSCGSCGCCNGNTNNNCGCDCGCGC